jgi:hypothetical protein
VAEPDQCPVWKEAKRGFPRGEEGRSSLRRPLGERADVEIAVMGRERVTGGRRGGLATQYGCGVTYMQWRLISY